MPTNAGDLPPIPFPPPVRARRSIAFKVAVLVLFVLASGGLGVLLAILTDQLGIVLPGFLPPGWELSGLEELGLALTGALVIFLFVSVHEAGHVLGGKLAGFRFFLFVVGPLQIQRLSDRLEVRLNRNLALAGGLAGCVPQGSWKLRRRTLLMVAGGPLASLVTGGAALLLHRALGLRGLSPDHGLAALYGAQALLMYGGGSLAVGFGTLIPARASGFLTDGARLLQLAWGGAKAERDVALLAFVAFSQAGQRPRDWDPSLIEPAEALADGSLFEGMAHLLLYNRALDCGDLAAARAHLKRTLALAKKLPTVLHTTLWLEAAWFEAAYRRDAAAAQRWLLFAKKGSPPPAHTRLRAEAAYLLLLGKPAAAAARANLARDILAQRRIEPGTAAAQREWLEELFPDLFNPLGGARGSRLARNARPSSAHR